MANGFFAAALAHGLRGDQDALREWWDLASEIAHRSSTNEMRFFVAYRVELHTGLPAKSLLGEETKVPAGHLAEYAVAVAVEVAAAKAVADDGGDRTSADVATTTENPYANAFLRRARGRLHADPAAVDAAAEDWRRLGARFEYACTLTLIAGRRAEGMGLLAAVGCPPPQ
jgi:hypothetical protein